MASGAPTAVCNAASTSRVVGRVKTSRALVTPQRLTEIRRSRSGDHKWDVGERRTTPDVVEAVQFRSERQADFVHNGSWIAFVNDSLEIVDSRPAGDRLVTSVLEDAPHEFGNRGLLTEGNHGAASAEHVAAHRKRGATAAAMVRRRPTQFCQRWPDKSCLTATTLPRSVEKWPGHPADQDGILMWITFNA